MIKKLLLCVLDGVGYSEKEEFNAVKLAQTPNLDRLFLEEKWVLLRAHGSSVGLPDGQMGNSEVGHITMGAGKVIKQDITRISEFLAEKKIGLTGKIHIISLLSDGGVHSHISHLQKIIEQLNKQDIFLHLITDGRDTAPKYALDLLSQLGHKEKIGTICGRFFAMDRDKRWERTEKYLKILIDPNHIADPYQHIVNSYQQNIEDEFIEPIACNGFNGIKEGDTVLIANFRADRAKQICYLLAKHLNNLNRYSLTKISEYFTPLVKEDGENYVSLGEYLSRIGAKQLRLAESEKFAHVTYFFNGGKEEPFPNEERIIIPSPKVDTYDQTPQMSGYEITEKLIEAIKSEYYDFILVNYANGDMVGHTGNLDAAIKAVEVLDECLGKVIDGCKTHNYQLVITADHGNVEEMADYGGEKITSHSTNAVPFIVCSDQKIDLSNAKGLADVAGIVMKLMNIGD